MFHTNMAQNAGTLRWTITAGNAAAAALIAGGCWIVNSANSMQVNFSSAPPATTAYVFGFVGLA